MTVSKVSIVQISFVLCYFKNISYIDFGFSATALYLFPRIRKKSMLYSLVMCGDEYGFQTTSMIFADF